MFKKLYKAASGVSNIELFYDLIFVYCISVITGVMHHPEGGFFGVWTFYEYAFTFLVVMQVWFFTTFLLNRYGDDSAGDNICLFVNMFLLYFLAACVDKMSVPTTFSTFNLLWAALIADILVHWVLKRLSFTNLDDEDRTVMNRTIAVLAIQIAIIVIAAFAPTAVGNWASLLGFLFGWLMFIRGKRVAKEESRFDHLAERCSLLVIVTFGETIVAIATYMVPGAPLVYPVFVFALVVGLFLVYFYEHDRMLDHHSTKSGIAYMIITVWIVFMVSNITVGLEYMPETDVARVSKSVYLMVALVLYLVTSFFVAYFNKPQFKVTLPYAAGRIGCCVIIIVCALLTDFDPAVNLIVDTLCVFGALTHEAFLFRGRSAMVRHAITMGLGHTEATHHVARALSDREVRRAMYEAMRKRQQG